MLDIIFQVQNVFLVDQIVKHVLQQQHVQDVSRDTISRVQNVLTAQIIVFPVQ